MAKDKSLWWMGNATVVLPIFLISILYVNGEGVGNNWNINETNSLLHLFEKDGQCKGGMIVPLGPSTPPFCLRPCKRDDQCGKDHKCVDIPNRNVKVNNCVRKCDADDDCQFPLKCHKKEKYCFWMACLFWLPYCPEPLVCNKYTIFYRNLCTRRTCNRGEDTQCTKFQICNLTTKFCQCANGMGDINCAKKVWCEGNGKFKNCKDVNGTCKYIERERKVNCICSSGKQLHPEENICRETCDNEADCKHGGTCEEKGGHKFCSCKLGVIGDYCETVFDCTPDGKYKHCESSGGKCFYDGNKAICECPRNQKFNDKQFICDTCICRGGECVIEEGKKDCKCSPGYGNFTNFSCRACDCGPDTSCLWEARFGGNKICICKPGYSTKKGKCAACECGPDSKCEWISEGWLIPEKKVCHCKQGYHEENGNCVDKQDIGKL